MTNRPLPSSTSAIPHGLPEVGVIVVAAGQGVRLGADIPKAFVELGGSPLLEHCIRTVLSLDFAGHLVLVVPSTAAAEALELADECSQAGSSWEVSVVAGGRERHESVRFGLEALAESITTVVIHDAARPLTSAALFHAVIAEVHRTGAGVVPALPLTDTVKRVDESGTVRETVNRHDLVAVQTPQGFRRDDIVSAHATAQLQGTGHTDPAHAPTDDAEVLQRAGGTVHIITGEERARKVTVPEDIPILESFLQAGERT